MCKDSFDCNSYQWQDEGDRIKDALSKLNGSQVASFAKTYQNQMTGELGHTRQQLKKYGISLPNKLYVTSVPLTKKKRPYEKCYKSDIRMTLTNF